MPYIIKNGKTYTGNSVTLTQAQYDALSEAEKNNGVAYYIYDSNAVLDASDVALDNGTVEDLAGSVATIETSPTVTNHVVGEHILWNGQLYEVISAIEAGEDLTINTNISARSVGEELSSLKNGLTWKLWATVTGKTLTQLPTNFSELHIVTKTDQDYRCVLNVVKDELADSTKWYLWGGLYNSPGGSSTPFSASGYISKTSYQLYSFVYSTVDKADTAITLIYYR